MTALLYAAGLCGPHVDRWRDRVRSVVRDRIVPLVDEAERTRTFPRAALAELGRAGLIRERWTPLPGGDPGRAAIMAEELARAGGVGIGAGLVVETVAAALARYGRSPLLEQTLDAVLQGELVGCFGASEPAAGSDLTGIQTTAVREGTGWRVSGEKKYVSLGGAADFALILCRTGESGPGALTLIRVPAEGLRELRRLGTLGVASLGTTWMKIDALVPNEAVVGRPGLGLMVATWALSHERLAVAAHSAGVCGLAIGLACAHLHRREQFGRPLIEHQALRLRLAGLQAELTVLRGAVHAAAATAFRPGGTGTREAAALKVTAVRLAERTVTECMHLLGGTGYLEDEAPMARMWRDVRLGRVGGGTDEMMWEMVAAGLVPDFDGYDATVRTGR